MLSFKTVIWRCSVEKVFLEISQNSHENSCARNSFLIKLQSVSGTGVFLWILQNFWKHFFTEHLRWLLLVIMQILLQYKSFWKVQSKMNLQHIFHHSFLLNKNLVLILECSFFHYNHNNHYLYTYLSVHQVYELHLV